MDPRGAVWTPTESQGAPCVTHGHAGVSVNNEEPLPRHPLEPLWRLSLSEAPSGNAFTLGWA